MLHYNSKEVKIKDKGNLQPLKSTPEKIQSRLSYAIEEEEEMDELEEAQEIGVR